MTVQLRRSTPVGHRTLCGMLTSFGRDEDITSRAEPPPSPEPNLAPYSPDRLPRSDTGRTEP